MTVDESPSRAVLNGNVDTLISIFPATLADSGKSTRLRLDVRTLARLDMSAFQGLLLVDGRRFTPAQWRSLDERAISRVEIIGPTLAVSLYREPAAANGVILVTRR